MSRQSRSDFEPQYVEDYGEDVTEKTNEIGQVEQTSHQVRVDRSRKRSEASKPTRISKWWLQSIRVFFRVLSSPESIRSRSEELHGILRISNGGHSANL